MARRGHGEGSIHQRGDGLWCAIVELGRDSEGKRKRKYIYGKTRREVAGKLRETQTAVEQGTMADPGQLTIGQFLDKWLEQIKPSVELRTWVGYESHVRIHLKPALGRILLKDLRPLHLQELYAERLSSGRSARTVRHTHAVMHNALGQAVKWLLVARNVAEAVEPPQAAPGERQFLNQDQARQLLVSMEGERLGPLFCTAILTGLREGELSALRWVDVDLAAGAAIVEQTLWYNSGPPKFKPRPKNGHIRRVALPAKLVTILCGHQTRQAAEKEALGELYQDYGLIFCREDGAPLRTQYMLQNLHRVLRKARLPEIRFHDLRHSAASLLLALGVPLKDVSELLGHSTITITADLYGHLLPGALEGAAQKLNDALFDDPKKRRKR